MAFSFVDKDNVKDVIEDARRYMRPVFEPLDDYERIARNRPHPSIDSSLPRVTDGTLAAIIQEQPKRVVQQVPTGKVDVTGDIEWAPIIINHILTEKILRNANCEATPIQKAWAALSKAKTYGSQPGYCYFGNEGDYFGANFKLPYIKNVLLEPGKLTARASNVICLRSWYSDKDIDAIINKEEMLTKSAKERGEEYKTAWDLDALKQAKEFSRPKDNLEKTPNERDKTATQDTGVEIFHVFQRGIGADFYSFATGVNKIVRTKKNPDPRGVIPIHYLYENIDLSNPLGRGTVELSGGMQNFLDGQVQAYSYIKALMMNPPLQVWGSVIKSTLKYKPNAIWSMGDSSNNKAEPFNVNSSAINNFSNDYGLIKSQILNLNSSMDTSVSSSVGNPGFSKTHAGVTARQEVVSTGDNYLRKQFEAWFGEMCETMLNIHFAEKQGIERLSLDEKTAARIREVAPDAPLDESNVFSLDYSMFNDSITFVVDASTSDIKDTAEERDRLVELLDLSMKYGLGDRGIVNVKELASRIVTKSGVEDPEKIVSSDDQLQGGGSTETSDDDMQFARALQQRGYPPEKIKMAIDMSRQGADVNQIMQTIGASN